MMVPSASSRSLQVASAASAAALGLIYTLYTCADSMPQLRWIHLLFPRSWICAETWQANEWTSLRRLYTVRLFLTYSIGTSIYLLVSAATELVQRVIYIDSPAGRQIPHRALPGQEVPQFAVVVAFAGMVAADSICLSLVSGLLKPKLRKA